MARVPVLVDKEELDAYSYLRAPAYILRDEGEDEIAAITRIRQDRQKEPAGRINDSAAWKKYEDQLYKNNSIVLAQALGIRLS